MRFLQEKNDIASLRCSAFALGPDRVDGKRGGRVTGEGDCGYESSWVELGGRGEAVLSEPVPSS